MNVLYGDELAHRVREHEEYVSRTKATDRLRIIGCKRWKILSNRIIVGVLPQKNRQRAIPPEDVRYQPTAMLGRVDVM